MNIRTKLILATFRWEWIAWALVVLLCVATYWSLPSMQYRFGFKDLFDPGHPARQQYEDFQREFGQGPSVLVYFHGATVFKPQFLATMSDLSASLKRTPGVQTVLSPLDLFQPVAQEDRVRLLHALRPEIVTDASRLQQALDAPPFTNTWHKLLYNQALNIFVMIITPNLDEQDPRKNVAFMKLLEEDIRQHAERAQCDYELNGLFFITQEVLQVTRQTQLRLISMILPILFLIVWVLFLSFRAAIQVFLLLGVSIYLGYGAMVLTGIPLNFMSINFPLMILVIGTADIIHILAFYATQRARYAPRGAALRAAHRTLIPNLLTTLSTIGCIYFTSLTDLSVLKQFSRSLCLGIGVVFLVTMIFGPLLFQRSGLRPGRGAFAALGCGLVSVRRPWLAMIRSRKLLWAVAIFAILSVGIASTQRVNSNWYRKFVETQRLPRSLAFLQTHGMPISVVDCTVETGKQFSDLVDDTALLRDVHRIATALKSEPDILEVFTVLTPLNSAREQLAQVRFPVDQETSAMEGQRAALLRAYHGLGAFDAYLSRQTGRLRFMAVGNAEDSVRFLELRTALQDKVGALSLEVARVDDFNVTCQMIYWSHIMAAIPATFLTSLWGSILIVLVCFLLLARGWFWAVIAVLLNVMPVVAMFAFGRLMGWELSDNLCFLVSLSIGIAVDDTLHFLYHFRQARKQGLSSEAAAHRTFSTVGAALIVTSVLLMSGFAVCLVADIVTVRIIGALIVVSVFSALLLDMIVLPALLVHRSKG